MSAVAERTRWTEEVLLLRAKGIATNYFAAHQDVDDVIAMCWTRGVRIVAENPDAPSAYVSNAMRNLCFDIGRHRHRPERDVRKLSFIEEEATRRTVDWQRPVLTPDPFDADAVAEGLAARLPGKMGPAFLMRFNEVPYEEIAAQLDVTVSTARCYVNRARTKLQAIIAEMEEPPF